MHRQPDWEDRLNTYLDRVKEDTFEWGKHDCALYSAGAVKAMTGHDPAADLRDTYTDEAGAKLALREKASGTLLRTMRAWFTEHPGVAFAKRGDLVMLDRATVGVCVGQFSWFVGQEADGREGLTTISTAACKYAFAIPFAPVTNDE